MTHLICPRCGGTELTAHDAGPDGYEDDVSYTSHSCDCCGLWHDGWRDRWLVNCDRWTDEDDAEVFAPTDRPAQIEASLKRIERDRSVTILFAVESGSRAWGFESTDSDYDVRGVTLARPEHYLGVNPRRDVLENHEILHPDALLDFAFWDLRKLLFLVTKSNPVAFEWLQSPLVYTEDWRFAELRPLLAPFFSPRAAAHHYLSMSRHNWREHMRDGEAPLIRLKKCLYVARPLLCLRWLEVNRSDGPPPMRFSDLLMAGLAPEDVTEELEELVERKRRGDELGQAAPIPVINAFIASELERWHADKRALANALPEGTGDVAVLDEWFARTVLRR